MNEDRLRELIMAALAREAAARVVEKLRRQPRHALVLFSGALLGFDQALASLRQLKEQGFSFQVLFSEQAAAILDQRRIEVELAPSGMAVATMEQAREVMKASYDVLLIPALTVRSAAVLAAMMADTPFTRIVQDALLHQRKIILCVNGCCPDCWAAHGYAPTPDLAQKMQDNLQKLQDYGLTLTRAADLSRKAIRQTDPIAMPLQAARAEASKRYTQPPGHIVSAASVAACPPHSVLRVAQGCLITQLARDAARARGIRIEIG